jgi:hypothetical protein
MADDLRHGVAADIGVVEHERITRVVAHGFDARDQLVIDDARRAVLELAHPFVDQRNQIDQTIGHGRIRRIAVGLGIDPLQSNPIGILVLGIDALRHRNDFGENVEFFGNAGPTGEQHVDDLFEIEQPERQFQVTRIENERAFAEAAAVFVMHVEQENPQVRPGFENFVQQQRYAARFADAGRAEHREVLGKHLLDIDIGDDGRILLQGSDIDLVRSGRRIDRAKFLIADQLDRIADGWVVGDAALEFRAVRYSKNFTEQIDRSGSDVIAGGRQILARHFGNHGDDGGICAADADKAANSSPHFRDAHGFRCHEAYPRKRSAHQNDASQSRIC